jgi:hypothetical protein
MTVGSYTLADTDGSTTISDPNALAPLAAGDLIDILGYAAVTTSPAAGTQNGIPIGQAFSSSPAFDTQYYSPTAEVDGVTAASAVAPPTCCFWRAGLRCCWAF